MAERSDRPRLTGIFCNVRGERRTRRGWLLAGVAVALAIAVLALLPPPYRLNLHSHNSIHQAAHIAAFAITGFFFFRGTRSPQTHLWLAALLLLLAGGTELAEHLLFHSALEYSDVISDAAGLFFGAFAATTTRRLRA